MIEVQRKDIADPAEIDRASLCGLGQALAGNATENTAIPGLCGGEHLGREFLKRSKADDIEIP